MSNLIRAQQLLNAAAEITHDEATKKIIEAVTIITDELKARDCDAGVLWNDVLVLGRAGLPTSVIACRTPPYF